MTVQNQIILLLRILSVLMPLLFAPFLAHANDNTELKFDIQVIPELQRYKDFLEYPAYLTLILNNNGVSPSLSQRTSITNARAMRIGDVAFRFIAKSGATYRYDASLSMNLGVAETDLNIPVTVDTTNIATGVIVVKLTTLLAKAIPSKFIDRVQFKAQILANVSAQKKVYEYLERFSKTQTASGNVSALFEPILMDAYNQSVATERVSKHVIRESPKFSDQWAFACVLVAWLAVVSFVAFSKKRHANRAAAS